MAVNVSKTKFIIDHSSGKATVSTVIMLINISELINSWEFTLMNTLHLTITPNTYWPN
jgi:hypothetical protein